MSVRSYLNNNSVLKKYIETKFLKKQGLFDVQAIQQLYKSFQSGTAREAQNELWKFYVFQMWYERFMK